MVIDLPDRRTADADRGFPPMVATDAGAVMALVFNDVGVHAAGSVGEAASGHGRSAVAIFPIRRWIERRAVVVSGAAVAFLIVFALGQLDANDADAVALLYVLPIAVLALEFGLAAGGLGCALALALVAVGSLGAGAPLDAVGFMTRGVAYGAIAAVAGHFAARMRSAHARQRLLLESGLSLAHLEAADDLPAVLALQAHKLCPSRAVAVELAGGSRNAGQRPAIDRPEHDIAVALRDVSYGTLRVYGSRSLTPEDHATLSVLAVQAAIAAENRRLLDGERERALVRAELQDARERLAERGRQLREVIDGQEAERDHVAHELREQSAQTLAAVLFGLGALERELGGEENSGRLGELRSDIGSTLRSLRALAAGLRPPLELGLTAALENLTDRSRPTRFGELTVSLPETQALDRELETIVYRVAEEALKATGGAQRMTVDTRADANQITMTVEGTQRPIAADDLALLRTRIELLGGTLTPTDSTLLAVIPLGPPAARIN